MQRTNQSMPNGKIVAIAPFTRVGMPSASRRKRLKKSLFGGLTTMLGAWWRRERERRELAAMNPRDFGDLTVPPSLVSDELRRWPWQRPSPQWGQIDDRATRARDRR